MRHAAALWSGLIGSTDIHTELGALCRSFDAEVGFFFRVIPGVGVTNVLCHFGVPDAFLRPYHDTMIYDDPRFRRLHVEHPNAPIFHDRMLFTEEEMRAHPFFKKLWAFLPHATSFGWRFAAPCGCEYVIGMTRMDATRLRFPDEATLNRMASMTNAMRTVAMTAEILGLQGDILGFSEQAYEGPTCMIHLDRDGRRLRLFQESSDKLTLNFADAEMSLFGHDFDLSLEHTDPEAAVESLERHLRRAVDAIDAEETDEAGWHGHAALGFARGRVALLSFATAPRELRKIFPDLCVVALARMQRLHASCAPAPEETAGAVAHS